MIRKFVGKLIAVIIILLFFNTSINPSFALETKSNISIDKNKMCLECQNDVNYDLIRMDKLMSRIEFFNNKLIYLSKFNPEINNLNEEISYDIILFKDLYKNLKLSNAEDRILCLLLESIFWRYTNKANYYLELGRESNNLLLSLIYLTIWNIYFGCALTTLSAMFRLECENVPE